MDDILYEDIEATMAFDGVLPPESASLAGQTAIPKGLAYQNTPCTDFRLRDRRSRRL